VLVVALVAVFGLGLGIGVVVTHGTMSAKMSSARDAEKRAQQTADQLRRQAKVSQQLALRNVQTAKVNQLRAAAQSKLLSQRTTWIRVCDELYSGAQHSTTRLSCIDAVGRGVSPETFQRQHPA